MRRVPGDAGASAACCSASESSPCSGTNRSAPARFPSPSGEGAPKGRMTGRGIGLSARLRPDPHPCPSPGGRGVQACRARARSRAGRAETRARRHRFPRAPARPRGATETATPLLPSPADARCAPDSCGLRSPGAARRTSARLARPSSVADMITRRRSGRSDACTSSASAAPRSPCRWRSWNSSNRIAPMPASSGSSWIMRVRMPSVTTSMRVRADTFGFRNGCDSRSSRRPPRRAAPP